MILITNNEILPQIFFFSLQIKKPSDIIVSGINVNHFSFLFSFCTSTNFLKDPNKSMVIKFIF